MKLKDELVKHTSYIRFIRISLNHTKIALTQGRSDFCLMNSKVNTPNMLDQKMLYSEESNFTKVSMQSNSVIAVGIDHVSCM